MTTLRTIYLFIRFLCTRQGKTRVNRWRELRRECMKRLPEGAK